LNTVSATRLGVANLPDASTRRPRPNSRARRRVRGGGGAVKVKVDAAIGIFVCTWEGNTGRKRSRAGRSYTDLNAAHVELSATSGILIIARISLVESNQLRPKKVISSWNVGDRDSVLTPSSNELVNAPLAATVRVLEKFHPDIAGAIGRCRGNVNQDWTLMRGRDNIIVPVVVVPFKSNLVTALNVKGGGHCAIVDVASQTAGVEILDGIVVGRAADVLIPAVSFEGAINPDTVDGGVSLGSGTKSGDDSSDGELHV